MSALLADLGPEPVGETPRCEHCHKVPPKMPEQTWDEWEALRFCDATCRRAHRLSRDELVGEVLHLWGSDSPSNIARRLGYQPPSLARRLNRCGRNDLAGLFARAS